MAADEETPAVLWHGRRSMPNLSLTFDDCYRGKTLQNLERLLAANASVKVTFFPVGQALINTTLDDPELWKRLLSQGHEIGYHGFDHRRPSALSDAHFLVDFERWLNAARQALGQEPAVRFARAP
jgi:peptidoglycan/xylan/chitin deacetylase (PgdA/CDA1 family)